VYREYTHGLYNPHFPGVGATVQKHILGIVKLYSSNSKDVAKLLILFYGHLIDISLSIQASHLALY